MSPPSVPVLKLEKEAPNVTLYLRELSGNKDYQYPPESDMVTCAARAVNVCRAMLNDPFVRQSLMGFIALYSIERPEARFRDLVLVAEQTEMFISSVCNDFPRLFVDDSITSPLVLGYHEKSPCDANFEPSNQCIYLNGEVVGTRDTIDCNVPKHANTNLELQKYVQRSDQITRRHSSHLRHPKLPELVVPLRKHSPP